MIPCLSLRASILQHASVNLFSYPSVNSTFTFIFHPPPFLNSGNPFCFIDCFSPLPYHLYTGIRQCRVHRKWKMRMDIIFCQPVTDETVSTVQERYFSLGWGEYQLRGSGNHVAELLLKWDQKEPYSFPDISDLGLKRPHKL